MEQRIALSTWGRREIFSFFSGLSNPFYAVTFRQDVTRLYEYVKKHQLSFYYTLIYLCTQAINEVEAFHYVIRQGEVYRIGQRSPSFTDLKGGSECFHIVTIPCGDSLAAFNREAKRHSTEQTVFLNPQSETDQLIYFSCLPWIDITAVTNERDLASPSAQDESIPRITWGRYRSENGRMELGISVEVNHRLIDGIHIGAFAAALTRLIAELN